MKKTTWPTKKLGEIINPQYGYTTSAKDVGKYRFVRITDIDKNGKLKSSDKKYISSSLKEIKNYILTKEDLLVARTGSIGRMLYFDSNEPSIFASYLIRLNPDTSQVFPKYIWLFSHTPNYWSQVGLTASGAVQSQFNANRIKLLKIPLPPVKIQLQIIEQLDAVIRAQELNDKQIALADELFQGLLDKELNPEGKNWTEKKLRDVANITSGGTPSRKKSEYFNGKIPWVKSGELKDGEIYQTEECITKEAIKNSSAKLFPLNTILIAMYGATVGKTGILKVVATTNQAIAAIKVNPKIADYNFIYFFLRTKIDFLMSRRVGGAQPNINQGIIKNLKILIPLIEIQRQIVEKLRAIQDYKKELLEQKQKLQELFTSCLDKAMKGELVS